MARPVGSSNKYSTKILMAELEEKGVNPFTFWIDVMSDENKNMKDRLTASKEIARYVLVPLEKQVENEISKDNIDSIKELQDIINKMNAK